METTTLPLVSILTPVYNGAEYLGECIESILGQTYANWEYTIVNNCSTDDSLTIALKYAARDLRIRVVDNDRFLPIIENHNCAVRQMSPESKYCKLVFADDWLYPTCIEEMVRLAEEHATVGLVGAYTTDGRAVIWQGPPYPARCVSGKELCRGHLLGEPYVFGTFTSLLVRCDLIRKRSQFFDAPHLHADVEACFEVLQESNFGFVHQVLSFTRPREKSNSAFARNFNNVVLENFVLLLKYGRAFLEEGEYQRQWTLRRWEYHRVLAHNLFRIRPKQFWKYHEDTLAAFGGRIDRWLLMQSVVAELLSFLAHPFRALMRGRVWWFEALSRAGSNSCDKTPRVSLRGDAKQ